MRAFWSHLDPFRVENAAWSSRPGETHGTFLIPFPRHAIQLAVIANSASIPEACGWEHVSVHARDYSIRCPTWEEMCFVKGLFWTDDECAYQFHPPSSVYKNLHPATLHLWRNTQQLVMLPPLQLV